jgi:hypothetical protein
LGRASGNQSKQATSANVRTQENVVNGEVSDLTTTVGKPASHNNCTGRPATILTPNGDWLPSSLGTLVYDVRANRINKRADDIFMAMIHDRKPSIYTALYDDEEGERRAQVMAAQRYKRARAMQRFDERPNPAEALSLAIEAADALATSYEKGGKRFRASKEQVNARKWALHDIVEMQYPMTVRQVFYQATVKGIIAKTEQGYDTVKTELGDMRKDGDLPYGWLVDNTRRVTRAQTFNSIEEALKDTAEFFRRGLWKEAPHYVEVWIEKDALAGVLSDVTLGYDVPLMVSRGYSSLSFLNDAAEAIAAKGKPCYIYHLGDYDPSGVGAARKIEETLRELAPFADIHFERLAVTPEQIEEWNLPSRPTKESDPRYKTWNGDDSVELDAIEPDELRNIVREAIERHVDQAQLDFLREQEKRERGILDMFAKQHRAS